MSTKTIISLTIVGLVIIAVITLFSSYMSYNNKEVGLRQEAEAQRGKIEAVHDQMWKIISQKAQVADSYKESFDKIYTHIIEGRYSKGDGSLMKWITESNPNFDTKLYESLMNSIEIERTNFTKQQERMLDIIREHETLTNTMPAKWFISNNAKIEYTVISSTKTKAVMESGKDDDTSLGL